MLSEQVKIVECPRDAWQGLEKMIPTEAKAAYLRKLIVAGGGRWSVEGRFKKRANSEMSGRPA